MDYPVALQKVEKTPNVIELEKRIEEVVTAISETPVTSETLAIAGTNLVNLRAMVKTGDKLRTEDVKPLNDRVNDLNAVYRFLMNPIKNTDIALDNEIKKVTLAEDARVKHEQEIEDRKADRSFEHKVDKGETPDVGVAVSRVVEGRVSQIKTEAGTVSIKRVKKWRYANDAQKVKATSLIPPEYWLPPQVNEKMLDNIAKSLDVDDETFFIPGIVFEVDVQTTARQTK